MLNSFLQEAWQNKCYLIISEILSDSYIKVFIGDFSLKENDKEKITHVGCTIYFSDGRQETIKGKGYGIVDALFNSIVEKFSNEYLSLNQIEFDDFLMRANFKSGAPKSTDSPVEIKLSLLTGKKQNIYFSATSRSMVAAAIAVIRKAFEYFINAEIAVKILQEDIKSAKKRAREDLMRKYLAQMTELVRIVSYENVLKGGAS